ncbi:hypothetical protein H112_00049 [Trichophyton rubrum D6]|uniref:Uncharacterized protein n=2 Tax=Trichophyton TaxID=5550 RepID=A0A022WHD5_TRIRU|nr:hypothetical protein H100_00047 [Trichophyton rubrum MR850]EZF47083.1 hypothetical protein H102_00046 [Trichophyton rubrum CBS 100081]EZF57734.1 hypothetical protein H103_00048 [Trichophyton rubrum CBS 288.86]EZF68345.1 hypothetical protein H104_00046 [Trichophyton rubrum CBS 289.86]EZF79009.1 hypothetical protein H105_00042 [Trichophyton soudanense CBS 452.61]EZF89658.1 hypothetical protein H110_00047 [Trichophyton rubrum MR1448]EZG00462.1 hypothetical protein H113_00049 [Trichophyton rub
MWIPEFLLVVESAPFSWGRDASSWRTQQTAVHLYNILGIGFPQTEFLISSYKITKMCRRNVSKRNFLCGHVLETLGSLVPEKGCGGCGIEKVEKGENNDIGSSHVHSPCDDCLAKDLWAQGKNGKWI